MLQEREREREWNKNWRVTTCFLSLIRYVTFPTTKEDTILKSFCPIQSCPTHSCHPCHPSWKGANSSKIASIIGFHPGLFSMSASPYQHQGQTSEFCIRFLVRFKIHQIWDPQDPTNAYGKWWITFFFTRKKLNPPETTQSRTKLERSFSMIWMLWGFEQSRPSGTQLMLCSSLPQLTPEPV